MADGNDKLNLLAKRLEMLIKQQENIAATAYDLQQEILLLKQEQTLQKDTSISEVESEDQNFVPPVSKKLPVPPFDIKTKSNTEVRPKLKTPRKPFLPENLERFIGENLINKIGILITVIGVFIGAKYALDQDLISPLTRIIFGYLMGLGLLIFAVKLKEGYANFSSVLLSGALAILYFITYAAFSFYALIPQALTFVLMVIFTVFAAYASIKYNKQFLALFGMVGAYSVPFLLSSDSGQVSVLFGYIAIINIGILLISFKKYWKVLFYMAFIMTWLIFTVMWIDKLPAKEIFGLFIGFLTLFFVIFYTTVLSFKLIHKENFSKFDIIFILLNSFIFFGLGYWILSEHDVAKDYLGVFAVLNGLIHFAVSLLIRKSSLPDKKLFYLVAGLVLTFITIAVPVQLDGNWVTLIWSVMAAILFWIGRTQAQYWYEKLSLPMLLLAFGSLVHDWVFGYYRLSNYDAGYPTPILNIYFLTTLVFLISVCFIFYIHFKKKHDDMPDYSKGLEQLVFPIISLIFLLSAYIGFKLEIDNYFNILFDGTFIKTTYDDGGEIRNYNDNIQKFRSLWIINYSMVFVSLLIWANIRWIKSNKLGVLGIILSLVAILAFLIQGLFYLHLLRYDYLNPAADGFFDPNITYIVIRYICLAFAVILLYVLFKFLSQDFMQNSWRRLYHYFLLVVLLWILSSELIHWLDLAGFTQSHKLALSIFWGLYSFVVIGLGILRNQKFLRIFAIVLFAITLIKLFMYDISHLDTIAKTAVFIILGILLLTISFLYNKFKGKILDDVEN